MWTTGFDIIPNVSINLTWNSWGKLTGDQVVEKKAEKNQPWPEKPNISLVNIRWISPFFIESAMSYKVLHPIGYHIWSETVLLKITGVYTTTKGTHAGNVISTEALIYNWVFHWLIYCQLAQGASTHVGKWAY